MNENEARVGSTVDGKYVLLEYLGCGGTGSVYRARHLELDNQVAIKIMHARFGADAEAVRRFQREAHLISELRHANIVSVYAFGSAGNILYMVMELLAGCSLRQKIVECGPLQPAAAIPLLLQVCAGMQHAHQHHVLHRDLKPDNVLVTADCNGREQAKIVDFGLARLVDGSEIQRLTQTGLVVGDPNYMSPEQAHGHQLDFRSDIYSFGCLMYETFAGQPPFVSDNSVVTLMKQVTMPPVPFAAARGLPPRLESIIMQSMAKSPDERFSSFVEMAAALEDFGNTTDRTGSTGSGTPPSNKFGAGRRSLFLAHLIVLLAIAGGAGALVWFWYQEQSQSQPVQTMRSPEAIELARVVEKLLSGQQPPTEQEALDLELRAQRVSDKSVLAYAKALLADAYYRQRKFEQSYIRARQALEMTSLPPAQQAHMHYIAGRSAQFTDRSADAEAYLQHALDSGNPQLPHDLVARDLVVVKLRVMRRQQAEDLAKTLDTTWVYRDGKLNPNLLIELLVLNSARRFDKSLALKQRILRAPLDGRSQAMVLAQYAVQTADFGAPESARQAMKELQMLLDRPHAKEERAFIEKKAAVSALFFATCAQHHETVIAQGPALLKRVSGADENDVWDRQNCAEALARSYQAVGRYEEANRLRDLRRGI